MPRAPLHVHLVMLGVVATWGGAFAAIKAGLDALSPWHLTLYRFAVAALPFALILAFSGLPRFTRAEWPRVVLVSIGSVALYHFALNYGETAVTAGAASLIVATGPVWTALVSAAWLGERITRPKVAGIVVAFAGVVVLVVLGAGETLGVRYAFGALVALAAPVTWAFVSVASKPLVAAHGPVRFSASTTLLGTLFLLPILLLGPGPLWHVPTQVALAVLFLGILATVVGYLGFNYGLSHLTPTETMAYVYLNPAFALLWSRILLGETPGVATLAGGALVLAGVALINWRR